MKVRLAYACLPVATGLSYDIEDIHVDVELPFVPSVGMMIRPTPANDYVEIVNVFLDFHPEGEGIVLGLKEPEDDNLRSWTDMQAQGWQLSNPD